MGFKTADPSDFMLLCVASNTTVLYLYLYMCLYMYLFNAYLFGIYSCLMRIRAKFDNCAIILAFV